MSATNEMILKRGVIVNSIGIVAKFSKALSLILFSTYLGAKQFGIYSYSFAIFDVACTMIQFSFGQALTLQFGKYKHRGLEKYIFATGNFIFIRALAMSTSFAFLMYFAIPHIFDHINHQEVYVRSLQIFCFAIPPYALKYNILYSIRASFDTKYEVIILSIVEPLLLFFAGLVMFYGFDADVYTLCYGLNVVFYLTCAISYWMYASKYRQAVNEVDPKFKFFSFVKISYHIAVMETMNMMMGRCDLLFIGYLVSPALVGIYGAAFEISSMTNKIKAAVDPTLPALIQKIHHENDSSKVKQWFIKSMFWILLVASIVMGFIAVDPNFFMSFFRFDPIYEPYFFILPLLAFGRLFHAVFGLIDAPLYMVDHGHLAMRISILNFACNFILFFLLVPQMGILGAGIGFILSALLTTIYRLYLTKRIFHIVPYNSSFIIPVICLVISVAVAKYFQGRVDISNYLVTALLFIIFGSIYFVSYQVLRTTSLVTKKAA